PPRGASSRTNQSHSLVVADRSDALAHRPWPTASRGRENMSEAFTGGCACGAIRYHIADEPLVMNDCQCRDCQRKSGTGHGSYLTFRDRRRVTLTGNATQWDMVADSGNVKTRGFCPTCGSPVYLTFSAMPDLFTVHAASLDDPSR